MKRFATLLRLSAGVCGCAALPLIGALAAGRGIARYLEFPPMTRYIAHAPFDGRAFALLGALNLLMVAGIVVLLKQGHARGRRAAPKFRPNSPFPFWGWAAAAIMLLGWLLAWTRFPWFRFFQAHTFCLPWLGYIILANALCVWRSGRSPMTHATGRFLMLFGVSTLFWWFFEFLNRFVQNWYYVGVQGYSPLAYVFHASVAFSTVLPAVMSTHRLLMTYPLFDPGLTALRPVALPRGKPPAMIGLLASALGLALVGWFPDVLYPLVWAAPLLVLTSLQALSRRPTIFYGLRSGDWAELVSAALAALICGFSGNCGILKAWRAGNMASLL